MTPFCKLQKCVIKWSKFSKIIIPELFLPTIFQLTRVVDTKDIQILRVSVCCTEKLVKC